MLHTKCSMLDVNMSVASSDSSSFQMSNQVLALSPKRLEEFVTHLANLQGDQGSINRFLKRFADFRLFNRRLLRALTGREYQIRDAKPKFMIGIEDNEIWRSK